MMDYVNAFLHKRGKTNTFVQHACEGGGCFTAAGCLYREQKAAPSHVMTWLITGGSSSL